MLKEINEKNAKQAEDYKDKYYRASKEAKRLTEEAIKWYDFQEEIRKLEAERESIVNSLQNNLATALKKQAAYAKTKDCSKENVRANEKTIELTEKMIAEAKQVCRVKESYSFAVKPNRTNIFERPGVCKKFKHTGVDVQGVINPYQNPQLLIMDLIDLLSMMIAVEFDPLQVKSIEQRVTALKELPDEFQEVGMKSMASDPLFFDASGDPQPPIDNVEVEELSSDTPLQITSM
ncbi:hypothetical protein L7F22_057840 [Adiantum nelumboides]|nr:hypothetical protein [Adiantum nelumboides]